MLQYVVITPARNEQDFIELTIRSMISQTILPKRWVIVSDGSTDNTDEIVAKYAAQHPWILLIRRPQRVERHFAGKAAAFSEGFDTVRSASFDIVVSLDADLSFGPDYFEFLLGKMSANPRLGVAGTPFTEGTFQYDYRFSSIEHVSGACQMFRRECFEAIGGYTPVKGGGIDLIAVVTARMKGWQTRTFPEKTCLHHRPMGSAMNRGLKLRFKWGQSDYRLGSHPLWQTVRCIYQMRNKPYLIGGALYFAGYLYSFIFVRRRAVTREFATFRGREQMARLFAFLKKPMTPS